MRKDQFIEVIGGMISPHRESPEAWLKRNGWRFVELAERYCGREVIGSLEICLAEGKLQFFCSDFGFWRKKYLDKHNQVLPYYVSAKEDPPTEEEEAGAVPAVA